MDVQITKIGQMYGPMAALPMLEEYLTLGGVRNVKQTLMAVEQSLQMQAEMAQQQIEQQANQNSGNGKRPSGKSNGKMQGERAMVQKRAQGQAEM